MRRQRQIGVRSIDGAGNNLGDPDMGRAGMPLLRLVPADYADGVATLAGPDRRSAREISNLVVAQSQSIPSAYRFGHSAVSATLLRLGADGAPIAEGNLALRDAFFAPARLASEGGIDPILRGLARQVCQAVDPYVSDELRNFLFGPPGAGGFDLASLNIQRGRDHGLPSYNVVRRAFGLERAADFAEVTSDPDLQAKLAAAYARVDDVDLWVGGLAEDPLPDAMVGELLTTVIAEQFEALRDADRYWYTRTLGPAQRAEAESTTLAAVIRRNTSIGDEIADDAFHVP